MSTRFADAAADVKRKETRDGTGRALPSRLTWAASTRRSSRPVGGYTAGGGGHPIRFEPTKDMRRSGPDLTNAQKGESRRRDLVRETTAWNVGR